MWHFVYKCLILIDSIEIDLKKWGVRSRVINLVSCSIPANTSILTSIISKIKILYRSLVIGPPSIIVYHRNQSPISALQVSKCQNISRRHEENEESKGRVIQFNLAGEYGEWGM